MGHFFANRVLLHRKRYCNISSWTPMNADCLCWCNVWKPKCSFWGSFCSLELSAFPWSKWSRLPGGLFGEIIVVEKAGVLVNMQKHRHLVRQIFTPMKLFVNFRIILSTIQFRFSVFKVRKIVVKFHKCYQTHSYKCAASTDLREECFLLSEF